MKKSFFLFSFLFSLVFITKMNASHYAGGEITYICTGGNNYTIQLKIFQDCSVSSYIDSTEQLVDIISSCGTLHVPLSFFHAKEVAPLCASEINNSICNGGTQPGLIESIYQAQVNLTPCSDWYISLTTYARNTSVNIDGANWGLLVDAFLNNSIQTCNNSPIFNSPPIPYACIGQNITINGGVSEADGDSLYYELICARDEWGNPITYVSPYSCVNPIDGITIDHANGNISFTANTIGNYVLVYQVTEYDHQGNLIGTVMRDIEIYAVNCSNSNPSASSGVIQNVSNAILINNNTIEACEGSMISFNSTYVDANSLDSLSIMTNLAQVFPGSSFNITGVNPLTVQYNIQLPAQSHTNNASFSVLVSDNVCPISGSNTFVYHIQIVKSTNAGPDRFICGTSGSSSEAHLHAAGGTVFTWQSISGSPIVIGTNFSCDTCADPIATPSATTTYVVTSNLQGGCANVDTVQVVVVADFTYAVQPSNASICLNDDVVFNVTPNPSGSYTIDWTGNALIDNHASFHPRATFTSSGTTPLYFNITSHNGCSKNDSVVVTVSTNSIPLLTFHGDSTLCQGDSSMIVVNSQYGNAQLVDQFDPIHLSNWYSTTGITASTCGSVSGNALYFNDDFSRLAETIDLNASLGGTINFSLYIAQGNDSCDAAEVGEDVILQYSYDGGVNWFNINQYAVANYPNFTPISENIPLAAQTTSTRFRWSQPLFSGIGFDNWAIDNVNIALTGADVSYAWSPAIGLNTTTNDTVIVSPTVSTTYTVIASSLNGCADTVQYHVSVVPNFTINASAADLSSCLYSENQLNVSVSPAGSYSYQWTPSFLLNNDITHNPIAYLSQSGVNTFYVDVASAGGCNKKDSVSVLVSNNISPDISIVGDTNICTGDSTLLVVNNGNIGCYMVLVLSDNYGDGWNGANLNLNINGSLYQSYTIATGFELLDTIHLNLGDVVSIDFTSGLYPTEESYQVLDAQGSILFSDGPTPLNGLQVWQHTWMCSSQISYLWTPSNGLSSSTSDSVWVSPTSSTLYTIVATETVGNCVDSTTILVHIGSNFTYQITASDDSICLHDSVQFNVSVSPAGSYSYQWSSLGLFNADTITNPVGVFNHPGLNTISLEITNEGCTKTDTSLKVMVSNGHARNYIITGDSILCSGDSALLQATDFFNSCQLAIDLYDSYGDGWNGASLEIFVNGVLHNTFTLPNGFQSAEYVYLNDGDQVSLSYTSGAYPSEESFSISGYSGNILYNDGPDPLNGQSIWNYTMHCVDSNILYQWNPTTNLSDPHGASTYVWPSSDVTYTLTTTDVIGNCQGTSSFTVHVVPGFTLSVTQAEDTVLLNDQVQFTTSVTPSGTYHYAWTGATLNNDTIANPIATVVNGGYNYYLVNVSNDHGCVKSDTLVVFVEDSLTTQIKSDLQSNIYMVAYPNPFVKNTFVEFKNLTNFETISFVVYDLQGRSIQSYPVLSNRVNMNDRLSAGTYIGKLINTSTKEVLSQVKLVAQ